MEITAKIVMQLREMTGVGMMECKKALVETNGDLDNAVKLLREKGLSKAAKKADRAVTEGLVEALISPDRHTAALIQLACETDFVARTDDFVNLTKQVGNHVLNHCAENLDALLDQNVDGVDYSLRTLITEAVARMGENIQLVKAIRRTGGNYYSYIHGNKKLGVLVDVKAEPAPLLDDPTLLDMAKNVTMHIAACNPMALKAEDMDQKVLEEEREVYRQKAINEGKPEKILDKIVEGQIDKFLKTNCLLSQEYVKDPDKTVKNVVDETAKALNGKIELVEYVRMEMGK